MLEYKKQNTRNYFRNKRKNNHKKKKINKTI